MQYTREQYRNLECESAVQGRADFLFRKGDELLLTSKDDNDKLHAVNCYKKALKIIEEGKVRFPKAVFSVKLSSEGLRALVSDSVEGAKQRK
ncbi:hypothetical protein MASR2M78_22380 [Treponema sp.]